MRTVKTSLFCLLATAALGSAVQADNLYILGGGEILDVKILSVDANTVQYKDAEGKKHEVPSWKVEAVEYADSPVVWIDAFNAYQEGKQNAPQLFGAIGRATRDLKRFPWLEESAKYYEGLALADVRQVREAKVLFQDFVTNAKWQKSFYYPKALQQLVELNRGEERLKWANRMIAEAEAKKIPLKWKFEVLLDKIRSDKDLTPQARLNELDKLLKVEGINEFPGVRNGIDITIAGTELESGKLDEARVRFTRVAESQGADDRNMAEALYGIGLCYYIEMEKAAEADKAGFAKQAWVPLLHAYSVYKTELGPERQAEVLYKAAICFRASGDPDAEKRVMRIREVIDKIDGDSEWKDKAAGL